MDPASADPTASAIARVQAVLQRAGVEHRCVAPGEWGLTLDCAGWPLHIGLALRGGLLRAQAEVVGPGRLDPSVLLHRNRLGVLVRYAQSSAGAVWVHGELPLDVADGESLDRLLGHLVEAATWARYAAPEDPPRSASRRA